MALGLAVQRASTTYALFPTRVGILRAIGQLQDRYRTLLEPACRSCRGERAVNSAADAASSAAEWASAIPEQAKQVQAQLTEAVSASIRVRPMATVAGALVIGYLLGRLGHDS